MMKSMLKNLYKKVIDFDLRRLCSVVSYHSIQELKRLLQNEPWFILIPTVRKNFCIRNFKIEHIKTIESLYNTKFDENEPMKRFPEEFIWAMCISDCMEKVNDTKRGMFCDFYDLFVEMNRYCYTLSRSGYSNTMIDVMIRCDKNKINCNKEALNFFTKVVYGDIWKVAMEILIKYKYAFVSQSPKLMKERSIGNSIIDLFSTNSIQELTFHDSWRESVKEKFEELYSQQWNKLENNQLSKSDRLYTYKMWNIQSSCLNDIRCLLLKNQGTKSSIIVPTDYKTKQYYTYLNEKQKQSLDQNVSDEPITFCTGLPGTGKTEVTRSFVMAIGDENLRLGRNKPVPILICGVNGITVNVLRKRLNGICVDATVSNYEESEFYSRRRIKYKNQPRCLIMTMDMVYARVVYGGGIPYQDEIEILVVDEVQNSDILRVQKLLSILPKLTILRLFGDFNQIDPICTGRIFHNLFLSMKIYNHQAITELIENNRVRQNPRSKSIVKNVKAIVESEFFNTSYKLVDDDEGTSFLNLSDSKAIKKIINIFDNADDPTKIHIITPMRRTSNRLNNTLCDKIRKIVLRKKGWKEGLEVPFCLRNTANGLQSIIKTASKIRFCDNYKKVIIKTGRGRIVSDEVNNGELMWVKKVERLSCRIKGKHETMYICNGITNTGSEKRVVVGNRHVDQNDIMQGYSTTVDSMLGGQDREIIFYLGDNMCYPGDRSPAIHINIGWVNRNKIVTGASRASKKVYYISPPKVEFTCEQLIQIIKRREERNGRFFTKDEEVRKHAVYKFGSKQILKLMADLKQSEEKSDMQRYLMYIFNINDMIDEDFMIPSITENDNVDTNSMSLDELINLITGI